MKARNGFVSNSSSSSFILAYKTSTACQHCGRKDPDLWDLVNMRETGNSDQTQGDAKGKGPVLQYVKKNWYSFQTDAGLEADEISKMKKLKGQLDKLGKEWQVMCCQVSYHDTVVRQVIKNAIKRETAQIIEGDEQL